MTLVSVSSIQTGGELPEYPISSSERLDSHFFLQWNLKRWRGSAFRKMAYSDPEVGFFGFELFCAAQDETPIGTLPCNENELAFILHLPLERLQKLLGRDVTPLQGWYLVQCDNGEIRWAHSVVTEVALEALSSRRRNTAKNADDRVRKRLGGIVQNLKKIPGGLHYAASEEHVNAISDWIEAEYPGGSATTKRIKEALSALAG